MLASFQSSPHIRSNPQLPYPLKGAVLHNSQNRFLATVLHGQVQTLFFLKLLKVPEIVENSPLSTNTSGNWILSFRAAVT